ncbi:hypothetical protein [Micromonospora rhizosphaerae]|nr:hypothetical protein [Micromonospora rhizosphaerae]
MSGEPLFASVNKYDSGAAALRFIGRDDLEGEGDGEYRKLFEHPERGAKR